MRQLSQDRCHNYAIQTHMNGFSAFLNVGYICCRKKILINVLFLEIYAVKKIDPFGHQNYFRNYAIGFI